MTITRKIIKKAKNFLYDLHLVIKYSFGHTYKKRKSNKVLICIVEGHIGDILMDASAIKSLIETYQQEGKQVYVVCLLATKNVLELFMSFDGITFVLAKAKAKDADSIDVDSIEQFLKNEYFDKVITFSNWVCLNNLFLVACTSCNQSFEAVYYIKNNINRIRIGILVFVLKCLHRDYTNRIEIDCDVHRTYRTKQLLFALGVKNFKSSIIYIPKTCDFSVPSPYITISIDSSNTARRWSTEKFIQLINRLLAYGKQDIYLTGVHVERNELIKYESAFQNEVRVKNKVGKLQMKEWVELIRGSSLLIGVDSGAIHVAASVGTRSICLTGFWEWKRFMPYPRDIKAVGTIEPVCVTRRDVESENLYCYGCFDVRDIGYANKICAFECKSLRPCLCLQAIEVNDVLEAVQKLEIV